MSADIGLTIDAVHLAMNLEQVRAKVTANNIANANVPGSRPMRLNLGQPLSQLRASLLDPALLAQTLKTLSEADPQKYLQPLPAGAPLALDDQIAEMSAASGRYQALADGVSRQFALMQLAMRGGR